MHHPIPNTELILNKDGSIYHLNLLPNEIADWIITVGDPERCSKVANHFESIELEKTKREFRCITGQLHGQRISVISTGIGTDNIDIVLNELDALVNVDFTNRQVFNHKKQLKIIRIGTSGALQADVKVGQLLVSEAAFGMGVLGSFYQEENDIKAQELSKYLSKNQSQTISSYYTTAASSLLSNLPQELVKGTTLTCPGFYAPQGRQIRLAAVIDDPLRRLNKFSWNGNKISNFEMETAGIYLLASALGHEAISFNAILANRITGEFSQQPQKDVEGLIDLVLNDYLKKLM